MRGAGGTLRETLTAEATEVLDAPITVFDLAASSWAFRAAIAAAAFGSGGGIGFPSFVCNLTTCSIV